MRRLAVATTLAALFATGVAALSMAAPSRDTRRDALPAKPKLPPLPAEVKSRGKWQIGVKCDFPPFGWQDTSGRNRGYDVETARQFALWAFGSRSKVDFTCVTTASRIPTLQAKRVDIIVSTLTWTAQREQTIDYSAPYYGAAGKLLVKNATTVGKLSTWMKGKTITTTPGSIYDTWMKNCFKDTSVLVVSSPSSGVLAVKDGRADAEMFDDAFLVGVAANDPGLRLTNHKFLDVPWGVGIRKNEPEMKRWVNTAIRGMKTRDLFWAIMRRTIPRRFYTTFKQNVPRPKNRLKYPRGTVPESNCPS